MTAQQAAIDTLTKYLDERAFMGFNVEVDEQNPGYVYVTCFGNAGKAIETALCELAAEVDYHRADDAYTFCIPIEAVRP